MHLRIVRGLPGSGKSTVARDFSIRLGFIHIEADMYHLDEDGVYNFDASKIKDAHKWCQDTTRVFIRSGRSVVVANTFTQQWEIEPYRKIADESDADFQIITCRGSYGSLHGVPAEVIEAMAKRWEP